MLNELRIVGVALDCADPNELSRFHQRLLGATVLRASDDSVGFGYPAPESSSSSGHVDDHRPPTWPDSTVPKQMHLDLTAGVELDGPRRGRSSSARNVCTTSRIVNDGVCCSTPLAIRSASRQ